MMHNKMYKMSVFWVSRFGPCCEINLEVESRAQEAAGRAQEPWQSHQLLSGVPWYIYTQISISGRSIFGPGLQIFGCCERDNKWRKITIYVQYTIQNSPLPTSNGIWSFLFYVGRIGCVSLCFTRLCARVRVLLRQFVLCVIDTVARKVTRKPCSFAILITRTVIIIKYCSILYSMRFKGYVLYSHFIFQHPEYVCL